MSPMMMMMMMISIGKAIISATNNATHKFPASRKGKIESWGVLSLLGGLCNIVSLEVKEMVWGKRRLLDCCLCSVSLKMEGEERRGKERKASKCQDMYIRCTTYSRYYYFLLGGIVLTTVAINQSAHLPICLSIHLSICLSIVHVQRVLACLLTCWLLLFVVVFVIERST